MLLSKENGEYIDLERDILDEIEMAHSPIKQVLVEEDTEEVYVDNSPPLANGVLMIKLQDQPEGETIFDIIGG